MHGVAVRCHASGSRLPIHGDQYNWPRQRKTFYQPGHLIFYKLMKNRTSLENVQWTLLNRGLFLVKIHLKISWVKTTTKHIEQKLLWRQKMLKSLSNPGLLNFSTNFRKHRTWQNWRHLAKNTPQATKVLNQGGFIFWREEISVGSLW